MLNNFVESKLTNAGGFEIPYISVTDVMTCLSSLNPNKAIGIDKISNRFLKLAAPFISDSLTFIYNQCISSCQVPMMLKTAKVIPLHKKGPTDNLNNYRPISILSALTRPLEKHIHSHMTHYMESNDLFHPNQSAFRKNHSCQTSLLKITESLYRSCDNSKLSGLVFVDFSKAFDMIDHDIVLEKMKCYGISNRCIAFFKNYLTTRMQYVSIDSNDSLKLPVLCGVPQGSILGPLLFNIYINDLPLHISHSKCELFADDTTLLNTDSDLHSLHTCLNLSLEQLNVWCIANKMVVNPEKSECMLVCSRQKRQRLLSDNLCLQYNNTYIPQVDQHKHLGVIIDHNLQWSDHIQLVTHRIASRNYQLNCIKHFLDLSTRKLYYNAYIYPLIIYCSCIWGHAAPSHMKSINSIQKRALKTVFAQPIFDSSSLYKLLGILQAKKVIILNDCILLHKIISNVSPSYLSDFFLRQGARYFEGDVKFIIPRPSMDIFKSSFSFASTVSWNSLPRALRCKKSIPAFKSYLKVYLESLD